LCVRQRWSFHLYERLGVRSRTAAAAAAAAAARHAPSCRRVLRVEQVCRCCGEGLRVVCLGSECQVR
jgi:hypothetical protein